VIFANRLQQPGDIYNTSLERETLRRSRPWRFRNPPAAEGGGEPLRAYNEPTVSGSHNLVIEARDTVTVGLTVAGLRRSSGMFVFAMVSERNVHGLAESSRCRSARLRESSARFRIWTAPWRIDRFAAQPPVL
jgi:hypothetical protein